MKAAGRFRVYYNHVADAPLICCVTPATPYVEDPPWMVLVRGVGFDGVQSETVFRKARPEDDAPSFWLEASGELEVLEDGYAVIRAPGGQPA